MTIAKTTPADGLSPCVRGNPKRAIRPDRLLRSIPARAGEPWTSSGPAGWSPVYPRACGGTRRVGARGRGGDGLSPRVRGNPNRGVASVVLGRSIPARAGEPAMPSRPRRRRTGSIPARAGEPRICDCNPRTRWVYPRACGGTKSRPARTPSREGLSPRVRGNPQGIRARYNRNGSIPARAGEPAVVSEAQEMLNGSIPARAGEPVPGRPKCQPDGVYPRACGGTNPSRSSFSMRGGLSPRVRGNPPLITAAWTWHRVYPRACGGTWSCPSAREPSAGLSPRVRGNLDLAPVSNGNVRSIPARAGEPAPSCPKRNMRKVYPRACGGTKLPTFTTAAILGLSPRVRGNPMRNRPTNGRSWVYPRACGGTFLNRPVEQEAQGLSPRVRGNRAVCLLDPPLRRSIPARAGEPGASPFSTNTATVYPRACGGTKLPFRWAAGITGLSPRVRGNRPAVAL